ncbi:hypothetical protein Pla100_41640 [Neorhodopirellula pilleata]|uniref:Uncharacterized protein n=1 Tax=Neorhodopirellula pilleata TaxID=2714738 RepID=A0A5C6A2I5_9BACT|nr:hypothetical protein Pla100_41640 [Neorhodopirellula pilleata]
MTHCDRLSGDRWRFGKESVGEFDSIKNLGYFFRDRADVAFGFGPTRLVAFHAAAGESCRFTSSNLVARPDPNTESGHFASADVAAGARTIGSAGVAFRNGKPAPRRSGRHGVVGRLLRDRRPTAASGYPGPRSASPEQSEWGQPSRSFFGIANAADSYERFLRNGR